MHDVQTGFIYIWYGKDITTEGLEKRIGMKAWKHIQKNGLRAAALFLALTLMGGLCACKDALEPTEEEMQTVLTVDGMDVPYAFYRALVLSCRDRLAEEDDVWEDAQQAAALEEEIRGEVLQALRDFYAVFSLCRDYDIDIDGDYIMEQVDQALEEQMAQYDDTEDYAAALEKEYMNHSVNRLLEQREVCNSTLYYAMLENGVIETDPDALREIIDSDAFIRVKQILIVGEQTSVADDGSFFAPPEQHTNEEARQLAQQAREEYLAGADFDSLVEKYGESLYMTSNEDGYYLCRGMWDPVNEEAVFGLVVDQVSPVIESEQGYSVFLRCEKEAAYIDSHFEELCQDYYEASFTLALEEKSASLQIETTELYDTLSMRDMK